jgi:hypothetical protein
VRAHGEGFAPFWDLIVENCNPTMPGDPRVPAVIAALERELAILDEIGAHIAAAYLDAAIDQLRREQARR